MKKHISISALLTILVTAAFGQYSGKINIGIVPPLSSNWTSAPRATNSFSLNLIAGVSAGETGFAIAGFGNFVRHNADGLMIAGFLNTSDSGHGCEIAGFGNFAKTGSASQIAGFANFGGNVSGVQLAGFLNAAKNVTGVQIAGFLNIADTAACQIGFINISKNGEMSLGATIDEDRTWVLSLRSGGKFFYGIVGLGYNLSNKKDVYAFQAGFGAHLVHAEPFRLNAELTNSSLLNFKGLDYYRSAFALLPSIRLGNRVDLFAGPSFVYVQGNSKDDIMREKHYISSWGGVNGSDFHGYYIGYNAGIAILL